MIYKTNEKVNGKSRIKGKIHKRLRKTLLIVVTI